ncbi:MAG: hypothetical protein EXR72_10140 [Myxococcales bacterium]|nr:hypothetical protein [Myxococcales bacterium]
MKRVKRDWTKIWVLGAMVGMVAAGCGGGATMDAGTADLATAPDMKTASMPDMTMTPAPDLTMGVQADMTVLPQPDIAMVAGDMAMAAGDMAMAAGDMAMAAADMAKPKVLLKRESKSSAIAISDDDKIVAAVSPDDDILYLIDVSAANKKTPVQLAKGCEPRSVAYSPDYSFWVACRGNNTAVNVSGIDQMAPTIGTPVAVGSEPTAINVSPAGGYFATANYADGTVSLYNAMSKIVTTLDVGPNPRALAITNVGLGDESKETLYVTLMFGQAIGGIVASEGNDVGRQGIVVPITFLQGPKVEAPIKLAPIADTTFTAKNTAMTDVVVGAYPNQLQGIALQNGRGYVVSTAASPAGPVNFAGNVHPFVSVFDGASKMELPPKASGAIAANASLCGVAIVDKTPLSGAGTIDLAVQTKTLSLGLFPSVPVDIAFVPGMLNLGYVVSMSSDVITRVVWDFTGNTVCAGAANGVKQINLQAMKGDVKVPIGIVVRNDGTAAYVNSWAGREVEQIDFASQTVKDRIALSATPVGAALEAHKGKKFFMTSTGRWSNNGWGSCVACHPDGLSDNVTFVFATGPRQTVPLDSDYAKKIDGTADVTDQRILNWTAIFDEVHDFENNTRNVSGGTGAIVSTDVNGVDTRIDLAATKDLNLLGSVKALGADGATDRTLADGKMGKVNTAVSVDWDQIDAFVQTLRSQKRATKSDPNAQAVKNGRLQFEKGLCAQCHGGPKWTISRRHYTPKQGAAAGSTACSLQTTALAKGSVPKAQNNEGFHLMTERLAKACMAVMECGGTPGVSCANGFCTVNPQRLTCSLRNVGTFGAGTQGAGFELRSDTDAMGKSLTAEGTNGFNVPSLLSLSATGPYLHGGQAQTLTDLFTKADYTAHKIAGNANFAPTMTEIQELVAFLQSIDNSTTTIPLDAKYDLCVAVAANMNACTSP